MTSVVIILGIYGCGNSLELSACWVRREEKEFRIAELGHEESCHWNQMWNRWHTWLRKSAPQGLIEVSIDPSVSQERIERIKTMIEMTAKDVHLIPWTLSTELVYYHGQIGRFHP
ncbi:MAG: hypothetical protein ABIP54_04145 [Candidatus Andersenbacteria bacterium]